MEPGAPAGGNPNYPKRYSRNSGGLSLGGREDQGGAQIKRYGRDGLQGRGPPTEHGRPRPRALAAHGEDAGAEPRGDRGVCPRVGAADARLQRSVAWASSSSEPRRRRRAVRHALSPPPPLPRSPSLDDRYLTCRRSKIVRPRRQAKSRRYEGAVANRDAKNDFLEFEQRQQQPASRLEIRVHAVTPPDDAKGTPPTAARSRDWGSSGKKKNARKSASTPPMPLERVVVLDEVGTDEAPVCGIDLGPRAAPRLASFSSAPPASAADRVAQVPELAQLHAGDPGGAIDGRGVRPDVDDVGHADAEQVTAGPLRVATSRAVQGRSHASGTLVAPPRRDVARGPGAWLCVWHTWGSRRGGVEGVGGTVGRCSRGRRRARTRRGAVTCPPPGAPGCRACSRPWGSRGR